MAPVLRVCVSKDTDGMKRNWNTLARSGRSTMQVVKLESHGGTIIYSMKYKIQIQIQIRGSVWYHGDAWSAKGTKLTICHASQSFSSIFQFLGST